MLFNTIEYDLILLKLAPGYTAINKGYSTNFYGVIRDIVFDSKLISFNNPVSFKGVGIGHEGSFEMEHPEEQLNYHHQQVVGPPMISSFRPNLFTSDRMVAMPAENYDYHFGCASTKTSMQMSIESDAMRFGDHLSDSDDFISLETTDNTFYGDFGLTFSFRTFYPNGVLFTLARNGHHHNHPPHHHQSRSNNIIRPVFVVALVDGILVLRMKMSEKYRFELHSSIERPLNDGQWHYVAVGRTKLSLWLNVDHKDMVENNNPKRRLALKKITAFIGGLPENIDQNNGGVNVEFDPIVSRAAGGAFLPTTEPFKGCLKHFYLNERHVDFKRMHQSDDRKCYSEIEKGVYFNGNNSWATYDEMFNIGLKADISFEFKTTKHQGVLFSMSNGTNEVPSLSIELADEGKIVASVDLGLGPFRAQKKFKNKFELCDGHWHTVKVQYTKNSISLKIDRHDVVYGLIEHSFDDRSLEPFTEAPLYIGGLPQGAPSGSLFSRKSFHGCMRNIEINDRRKDWLSDIKLFNNIDRNACPASIHSTRSI